MKRDEKIHSQFLSKALFVAFVIIISTVSFRSTAFSQTEEANYALLKAGIYSPQASYMKGFGTGFNGEIALGHYFDQFLAMEISAGYFRTTVSETIGGIPMDGTISVVPITLSVRPSYKIQNFEMYALGGFGMYIAKAESSKTVGATLISASDTDIALGIHFGAGALFNITPKLFLGVEGKYFWVRPKWEMNGASITGDIDGFILTGNLGFRF